MRCHSRRSGTPSRPTAIAALQAVVLTCVLPVAHICTCLLSQLLARASNRRKSRNALAAEVAAAAAAAANSDGEKEAELVDLLGGGGGGGSSRAGKGRKVRDELHQACT